MYNRDFGELKVEVDVDYVDGSTLTMKRVLNSIMVISILALVK